MVPLPLKACVVGLLLAVVLPQLAAGTVGDTLEQCIALYGEEQPLERTDTALFKRSRLHAFASDGMRVVVEILGGKAVATTFCREKSPLASKPPAMTRQLIEEILSKNNGGAGWQRVAASTMVSQWVRRDGEMMAVYDPLDHHLVLSATKVDDSVVEAPAPKPMPEPVARVTEEPSSAPPPISLPDTLTIGGETYKNPTYRSHNEFLLNITHETGVASVLIGNLSPSLQAKLGFDREAAASAQAAFAELQNQAAKQHIENQVQAAESREELAKAAQPTAKQAKPQGLDLSHPSLNGGSAIWTDEVAANLFDLNGKIISVRFIPTARHAARQRADGFYEVNVLPDGSDILVKIPVEIGRKWFSVKSNRKMPNRLIVRVDVGELENVFGTVREGAILTALGTKVRRGASHEGSWVEW